MIQRILCALCLLCATFLLFSCSGQSAPPSTQGGSPSPESGGQTTPAVSLSTPEPMPSVIVPSASEPSSEETPEDARIRFSKNGNALTVSVSMEECAGKEASVILLSDREAQNTWKTTDHDKLIDLAQIALDENGNGSAILTARTAERAYLCVTVGDQVILKEVN